MLEDGSAITGIRVNMVKFKLKAKAVYHPPPYVYLPNNVFSLWTKRKQSVKNYKQQLFEFS